ncbi:MAG: hypothetical protein US89_C0009G0053 [Candidatus Peregrinibacteria bacterium GW2011_GWF2_38_29]|nr:MAG: hypothetical protein US89_C0009G0053 [Candidatus Peregrinibacteria bacterium GW2011_GWF2_38_29]HBB02765.1 hypothetical protein [Candidatus Peregrinibacteria bacterium]
MPLPVDHHEVALFRKILDCPDELHGLLDTLNRDVLAAASKKPNSAIDVIKLVRNFVDYILGPDVNIEFIDEFDGYSTDVEKFAYVINGGRAYVKDLVHAAVFLYKGGWDSGNLIGRINFDFSWGKKELKGKLSDYKRGAVCAYLQDFP